MKIKKFNFNQDYEKCIRFLTESYKENQNIQCWLPQRFDDFIFRIGNMERHKRSIDFIYLCEEDDKLVGLIVPDDASFNSCIKTGYEHVFGPMVAFAEKNLSPLFEKDKNGPNDFFVVSH